MLVILEDIKPLHNFLVEEAENLTISQSMNLVHQIADIFHTFYQYEYTSLMLHCIPSHHYVCFHLYSLFVSVLLRFVSKI